MTGPEGTGDALRQAVTDLVELRQLVQRAQARRPFLALAALAIALVDELEQIVRYYLGALNADKPIDAQQHAAAAQRQH